VDRFDELEEKAGPELMPLIIGLRADMELFAAAAQRFAEVQGLALKQRQQILDAQAIYDEHNVG
jgi:hypothetical protein